MAALLIAALLAQADLVVLDNGAIRIEVDPAVFSVRYVGLPDGLNFVEALPVTEEERKSNGWVDPGGLHADVLPFDGEDATLRRGPAELLEQTSTSVKLRGPVSAKHGIQLEKEIRLEGREPRAFYVVSILAAADSESEWAVRNTVRVPLHSTLRVERSDGTIAPLAGTESIFPAVVKSMKYWLIPVPPTARMKGVALAAFVPEMSIQNKSGVWTRSIVTMPNSAASAPQQATFVCLLDDETASYSAMLQGAAAKVGPKTPAVFREEWKIEKRGR